MKTVGSEYVIFSLQLCIKVKRMFVPKHVFHDLELENENEEEYTVMREVELHMGRRKPSYFFKINIQVKQ
jgi:hypothetical protein